MNFNLSAPSDLPIVDCLPQILAAVASSTAVVIKAPPGAGKTTGVPLALRQAALAGSGQMLLVQPRRLAARSAASRLSHLIGEPLGSSVGYHVRFDKCLSRDTRLIAMTTGVLLRRLHSDPLLERVTCVLLDEFHERSLEIDLALGMLHRIRSLRPELKLLVMSATLDPTPIAEYLGNATAVISEGRSYPVTIEYVTAPPRLSIEQQVESVLPGALRATAGHVLIFLPGVGEIKRTRQTLEATRLIRDLRLCELYGDLPSREQDAVLADSPVRKLILATNVAETSLTIPGVTCVIDSGQARVMRFDSHVGLPRLQLEAISQASAEQRAGRAGRTAPGICYRLWPAAAHRARRECDTPEIERGDFSSALLTLAGWGERDIGDFPWLTPPPKDAVDSARRLLARMGAIDEKGGVTPLGNQMLSLPLHPRLSRFMVESKRLDIVDIAASAAALLTERDPFRPNRNARNAIAKSEHGCDVADRVAQLRTSTAEHDEVNVNAAKQVRRVAGEIGRMVTSLSCDPTETNQSESERLKRALIAAYPDRVARRRGPGSDRGVMVGGRGVRLDARSTVREGEWFLCIDVDSTGTEALVRSASAIDPAWLDTQQIRDVEEPFYNPTLKAVVARRRRYFEDLMLGETPIACLPSPQVAELLADQVRGNVSNMLPSGDQAVAAFIARVRFLTIQMPELKLPPMDDQAIDEVLLSLCQSRTSIAELRAAPWLDHLRSRYDYEQTLRIDNNAPARMLLPSGNSVAIQYVVGKPPFIEVRIQELFGWQVTPRIAGDRVPIQLHLLGPNYRPQQITEDLANFWKCTYGQTRKELRRRYPKHHWPEDPSAAVATRNGLKPK